jgi:hypothetical protein
MDDKNDNHLEQIREYKRILLDIIQRDGRCNGALDCSYCPLAKMWQRDDGSFYSCTVAVAKITGRDPLEIDDRDWKDAAVKTLLDVEIEEMLLSDPNRKTSID